MDSSVGISLGNESCVVAVAVDATDACPKGSTEPPFVLGPRQLSSFDVVANSQGERVTPIWVANPNGMSEGLDGAVTGQTAKHSRIRFPQTAAHSLLHGLHPSQYSPLRRSCLAPGAFVPTNMLGARGMGYTAEAVGVDDDDEESTADQRSIYVSLDPRIAAEEAEEKDGEKDEEREQRLRNVKRGSEFNGVNLLGHMLKEINELAVSSTAGSEGSPTKATAEGPGEDDTGAGAVVFAVPRWCLADSIYRAQLVAAVSAAGFPSSFPHQAAVEMLPADTAAALYGWHRRLATVADGVPTKPPQQAEFSTVINVGSHMTAVSNFVRHGGVDECVTLLDAFYSTATTLSTPVKKSAVANSMGFNPEPSFSNLCGAAVDEALTRFFAKSFEKKSRGINLFEMDKRAVRKLAAEAERAKKVLSSSLQCTVAVEALFEGMDFSENFSRSRMDAVVEDVLNFSQLLNLYLGVATVGLRKAMAQKQGGEEGLNWTVVVAGGTSRIQLVQTAIERFATDFVNAAGKEGLKVSVTVVNQGNGEEVEALGAALHAATINTASRLAVNLADPAMLEAASFGSVKRKQVAWRKYASKVSGTHSLQHQLSNSGHVHHTAVLGADINICTGPTARTLLVPNGTKLPVQRRLKIPLGGQQAPAGNTHVVVEVAGVRRGFIVPAAVLSEAAAVTPPMFTATLTVESDESEEPTTTQPFSGYEVRMSFEVEEVEDA